MPSDYFTAGLEAFAGTVSTFSRELSSKVLGLLALSLLIVLSPLRQSALPCQSQSHAAKHSFFGYGFNTRVSLHLFGRIYAYLSQLMFNHHYDVLDDEVLHDLGDTPVIYISNHQSSLDLSTLGAVLLGKCPIMVKTSLRYVPFVGLFLWLSNAFFVDRKNHSKALATTAALAKFMQETRLSVLIYPEGTRSGFEEPALLPFKKGAFHIGLETGFPIVPIVFSNTNHLFCPKRRRFEGGGMGIKVLRPIYTQGKTKENLQEIIDEAQSAMLECLKEISAFDYNKL
ncbi:1-acylglycerol-3-phosphate O-acyltransferase [Entomophthora muscae]|uniref:1-acylglycerol-3-phosphate O-acyltransferase n=1 Tax=Entomophthora muscae TaxID=34485 RepID=A0ACC2RZX6_9FUNG|nr:1-acylglycerol-3-phosphate O-acyltransferase [Entomophthora muscae]